MESRNLQGDIPPTGFLHRSEHSLATLYGATWHCTDDTHQFWSDFRTKPSELSFLCILFLSWKSSSTLDLYWTFLNTYIPVWVLCIARETPFALRKIQYSSLHREQNTLKCWHSVHRISTRALQSAWKQCCESSTYWSASNESLHTLRYDAHG